MANSGISNSVKSAAKGNTSIIWQEQLVPNDYLEIWCENNDDAEDIEVEDMNITVN